MFKRIFCYTIILMLASLTSFSELRGVWLTTNSGLDWPGRNYDEEHQKRQMIEMLDKLQKAHFNLILFQVQANGDVAWNSRFQPAMSALTGNGSKCLSYDVCRFVVDECHRRNMKCHAWVVPYRVGSLKNASSYTANKVQHIIKKHPKWCIKYSGNYYIDPANPEAREYLVKLYTEMAELYDFDGINLDYTRYPGDAFPDERSYKKYAGKNQRKADWRRENINKFVAELYSAIKKIRPDMVVGSAPIGTYKNVEDTNNSTAYESYQQDPVQWVQSGNHDMVIPQMYWDEKSGFSTHLSTWVFHCGNVSLLVGLAPYKMIDAGWNFDVIKGQIEKSRNMAGVAGVCFFRAEHVVGNNLETKKLYHFLVDTPLIEEASVDDSSYSDDYVVEKFME